MDTKECRQKPFECMYGIKWLIDGKIYNKLWGIKKNKR